ncbi:MAG: hypothetical protein KY464_11575 [Gemmatimonadetes bacterium]|nr:hypothetical protein [Gemmatimonadota bacterium]
MRAALLVLLSAGLASCATGDGVLGPGFAVRTVGTETATIRVTDLDETSVSRFVPAVEAASEGGECETLPRGTTGDDEVLYILSFPSREDTRRNISLSFDPEGRLLRYNDLRGDLRREKTGAMTAIVLDFQRGTAIASNEFPGGNPGQVVFGRPDDFLQRRNLDTPAELIQLVRSRCGAP